MKETKSLLAEKAKPLLSSLGKELCASEHYYYYRYHEMFSHSLTRLSFAACLSHYLDKEKLLAREEVAQEWLGVDMEEKPEGGFHLDLEDYLASLIMVSNELVRATLICYPTTK